MITPGSPASLPLRFPRTTVAVVILLAGACLPSLRGLRSDSACEQLLPRHDPEVVRYRELAASAAATTTPSTSS